MKILFDCLYLRNRHTGVDVYFLNLVKNILEKDKSNMYYILLDKRYNMEYLDNFLNGYSNYKTIRIRSFFPHHIFYSSFVMPFYLWFYKFEIYHNPYFFGPLFRISKKTKIIITVHDLFHRTIPHLMDYKISLFFRYFGENAIKKADSIIVVSSQTRDDVITYIKGVNKEHLNIIHESCDEKFNLKYMVPLNMQELGLGNTKYLLMVGKILPSKGMPDLLKAFKMILDKKVNDLIIVSAGTQPSLYLNELKKQISDLEIPEDKVKFLGYVNDNVLLNLYKNAEIFIYPSHYEGFGLPALEAMNLNCPVIARKGSSLIEVVGDGGLLFEDHNELCEQIIYISGSNQNRTELIARGKLQAKLFTWDTAANQTIKLYNN